MQKLTASDGSNDDGFGWPVAIEGDIVIVGAPNDDDHGRESGSAYIFREDESGNWVQIDKINPSDGEGFSVFGGSVALTGSTALIGAPTATVDDVLQSGAAYVFRDDGNGSWIELDKLVPSDPEEFGRFGHAVGISGGTALIGAHRNDERGTSSGAAYLFGPDPNGDWSQTHKFTGNDTTSGDTFGISIGLKGNTALIGAECADDHGSCSGSAYVFDLNCSGAPASLVALNLLDGVIISGGLSQLQGSDDQYLETEARVTGEVHQPHLLRLRVTADTDVKNASALTLTIEGRITDIEAQTTLRLRDFVNGGFVEVDQFAMGMNEFVHEVTIPAASRFVRAADGRIVLEVEQIVFFPFTLNGFHTLFDQVEIAVR